MIKVNKKNILIILSANLLIFFFSIFSISQTTAQKWQQSHSELNKKYAQARKLIQEKKYIKAKSLYKKILSTKYDGNPSTFNSQNRRMISFYYDTLKDYKGTISICKKIIKKYPKQHVSVIAGYQMGQAYEKIGKSKKAITAYRNMVDLHLQEFSKTITASFYTVKATKRIALLLGLNEEGIKEFQKLINENPDNELKNIKERAMINLIRNYSDFNKKPLTLFIQTIWKQLKEDELLAIFNKIINSYPQCKLIPYIHFRKADLFHIRYLRDRQISDFNKALNEYSWSNPIKEEPVFPETRGNLPQNLIGYRSGFSIQATVLYRSAQLIESIQSQGAEKLYWEIINKHPNEINFNGKELRLLAYISILDLQLEKNKNNNPSPKLELICKTIISKYDNIKLANGFLYHIVFKYLAKYYDKVNDIKNAILTREYLLKKHPHASEEFNVEIVRNLNENIKDLLGSYDISIEKLKEYLAEDYIESVKVSIQFTIAETMIKTGANFGDIAEEYRKVLKIIPKKHTYNTMYAKIHPTLAFQAERQALFLEKFTNYIGDPPNIEFIKALKPDYIKSPNVSKLFAYKADWVLSNLDELNRINKLSLGTILLNIGEKSISPLIELLSKGNDIEIQKLAKLISPLEKKYPNIVAKYLSSLYSQSDDNLKYKLLPILSIFAHPSYENIFKKNTSNNCPNIRLASLRGLYKVNSSEIGKFLIIAAKDTNVNIKRESIKLMKQLGQSKFIEILIEKLGDKEGFIAMDAVNALVKIGKPALPYIENTYHKIIPKRKEILFLYSGTQSHRSHLIRTAGAIKCDESFSFLKKCLSDPEHYVRASTVKALYNIAPDKTIPIMRRILKSTDPLDRIAKSHIKMIFKRDQIDAN
jgi:tetratricopeptide (TPR) repeat protein/HEAT repeat protein